MIPLLLIALQAAPAVPMPPPGGGSFSILARDPCPASGGTAADIIVCGRRQANDRAPRMADEVPDGPTPSNPDVTGAGADRAAAVPCAALQSGCQVGFNLLAPALMLANEARIGISKLVDKSRDKSQRIPIALDGPAPQGHLEP